MQELTGGRLWKVGEVAELARVTVRQLHHYDEIGLLEPSQRSDAGYRLYTEQDLQRLYQVLLFRELGFTLEAITRLLDDASLDRAAALRTQRTLLIEQRERTDAVIRAIGRALDALQKGMPMTTDDMAEGFDAFANAPAAVRAHQAKHQGEAQERWGDSDAYRESMRRVRTYSREDWSRIQAESEQNEARMAALLLQGADPEGSDARAGAEAMRRHIDRWYYPCSRVMHASLADMYEADPRFRQNYERRANGLAAFVAAAIRSNARGGTV